MRCKKIFYILDHARVIPKCDRQTDGQPDNTMTIAGTQLRRPANENYTTESLHKIHQQFFVHRSILLK